MLSKTAIAERFGLDKRDIGRFLQSLANCIVHYDRFMKASFDDLVVGFCEQPRLHLFECGRNACMCCGDVITARH